MQNRYNLVIDFKTRPMYNIQFVQNDIDTSVLSFTVCDGGTVVNLTGQDISVAFSKPDNTVVLQGIGSGVNIIDAINGKFEIVLRSQTLAVAGTVNAEISFSESGKKLSTTQFSFNVSASINVDQAVVSTNEFSILDAKILEATNKITETEATRQLAITATNDANLATSTANTGEADRVIAESARVTAENGRVSAESLRVTTESSRVTAEDGRVTAEIGRSSAETTRVGNENTRLTSESARVSAESDRANAETLRLSSESTRQSNEIARQEHDTAFRLLEAYDNTHAYVPLNKVTYNGSTYQNIVNCTGVLPTNTTKWILIAQKGADGSGVGDMLKSVYDTTNNGVVDDTEKLGGQLPSYYAPQSGLDATNTSLNAHLADTAPHGATASPTANKIVIRDANGAINVTKINPTTGTYTARNTLDDGNGNAAFSGALIDSVLGRFANIIGMHTDINFSYDGTNLSWTTGYFIVKGSLKQLNAGSLVSGEGWIILNTNNSPASIEISSISWGFDLTTLDRNKIPIGYVRSGNPVMLYGIGSSNNVKALSGGYKVQSGQISVVVTTAGTGVSVSVTFPVSFSSTPTVLPVIFSLSGGSAGYSSLTLTASSATGFTLHGNSYLAQTISVSWLAIGT